MRILVAAPYVGEIGWELMAWQGRVRRMFHLRRFHRLVVLGPSGRAAFYADMPLDYHQIDLSFLPGVAYEDRRWLEPAGQVVSASDIRALLEPQVIAATRSYSRPGQHTAVIWPEYDGQFRPTDAGHQQFIRYERAAHSTAPRVALVQRTRSLGAARNWSQDCWARLGDLLEKRGVRAAVYPENAEAAIELLSGCELAVGQSTGGMHLAALCACPRIVWGLEDYLWTRWEFTNRQRYETVWNPLGTPTVYHAAQRHPEPEQVAEWVLRALETIGRRSGLRLHRTTDRLRWHARRWAASHLVRQRILHRCPWPLQRWVRYGLI